MPPIWLTMDKSGPAACFASAGSASTQAPDTRRATGSHRRCHVSSVFSTQSRGVQDFTAVAPAGRIVTGSSHISARCTASVTAFWYSVDVVKPTSPEVRRCMAICFANS